MSQSGSDPHGFLMRFDGGPLSGRTLNVRAEVWTWPLPPRLGVLAHLTETNNVAIWDADGDGHGLPDTIWRSTNATFYRKVSESQMSSGAPHVARGAEYELLLSRERSSDE